MEFLEYPKALYLAGQQLVVDDSDQEDAARADGYDDWHADHARTTGEGDGHIDLLKKSIESDLATQEQPEELDRDALKARAAELGIEHPKNISTEKLAELVSAAE